jgi:hypothetical protein
VTLQPGQRLRSQVCTTEVMVVSAPSGDLALTCGGHALVPIDVAPEDGLELVPAADGGTKLGKRYVLEAEPDLQLLVTKPGSGALESGGQPLTIKQAKALPSSD